MFWGNRGAWKEKLKSLCLALCPAWSLQKPPLRSPCEVREKTWGFQSGAGYSHATQLVQAFTRHPWCGEE